MTANFKETMKRVPTSHTHTNTHTHTDTHTHTHTHTHSPVIRVAKEDKKNFMVPVIDGVQLPQGYSHFEKTVYVLPLSSHRNSKLYLTFSSSYI